MKDPFAVLEVAETATDLEIKKAYLAKVREYPPDRAPERFKDVRAAFETLQTQRDRMRYRLFHAKPPDVRDLLVPLLEEAVSQRPSEALFRKVLAHSLSKSG